MTGQYGAAQSQIAVQNVRLVSANHFKTDYDKNQVHRTYAQWEKVDYPWMPLVLVNTIIDQLELEFVTRTRLSDNDRINIIDIACGHGNVSRGIVEHVHKNNAYDHGGGNLWRNKQLELVGVDISHEQINMAKKKYSSMIEEFDNVYAYDMNDIDISMSFEVGDARNIREEYINKFDIALSVWCLNYSSNINELYCMFKSIYKILKPEGIAICVTPTMHGKDPNSGQTHVEKLKYYNTNFGDDCGIYYVWNDELIDGTPFGSMSVKTKTVKNEPFCIWQTFYTTELYDTAAKECGFIHGLDIIEPQKWNYSHSQLSQAHTRLAKKFFTMSNIYKLFILRKKRE